LADNSLDFQPIDVKTMTLADYKVGFLNFGSNQAKIMGKIGKTYLYIDIKIIYKVISLGNYNF
jgi:hypothetical protein